MVKKGPKNSGMGNPPFLGDGRKKTCILVISSLRIHTQVSEETHNNKNCKPVNFLPKKNPSDFPLNRVCVAVESRFHASVLINNGLLAASCSDLTDQNLNAAKERFCQCFSLVGLVSGRSKGYIYELSKAIQAIRKLTTCLT